MSNTYPESVLNDDVKKKKKHHPFRIILIILLVLLLILGALVGTIYGLFYDDSHQDLNVREDVNATEVMEAVAVDCIDESKTNEEIVLLLSEDEINQLLYDAYNGLNDNVKTFVKQIYVDVTDSTYDFYVEAEVPLMKTRLKINTTVSEYIDQNNFDNNQLIFKINNVSLGRVGGIEKLAYDIFKNNLDNTTLENIFKDAGLNIKVDLANFQFTYNEKQMLNDIEKTMGATGDTLFYSLLKNFYEEGFIKFSFNERNGIGATIDLKPFKDNKSFDGKLALPLEEAKTNIIKLLDEKIIDHQHVSTMFYYLLRGYNNVDNKAYIDSIGDLDCIGIADKTIYQGYQLPNGKDIGALIAKGINDNIETIVTKIMNNQEADIVKISEKELTSFFQSSEAIGYSFVLSRFDKFSNKNKVNYVSVSDFYANIIDDGIEFTLNLNINGCPIGLTILLTMNASSGLAFTLSFKDCNLGHIEVNKEIKEYLFEMIKNGFGTYDYLHIDEINKTIKISLESFFKDAHLLKLIQESGYQLQASLNDGSSAGEGNLLIALGKAL